MGLYRKGIPESFGEKQLQTSSNGVELITCCSRKIRILQVCNQSNNQAPASFATKNAAAAATAPMTITFTAPLNTGCPVTLLLKAPKIKRQIRAITAENFSP